MVLAPMFFYERFLFLFIRGVLPMFFIVVFPG